MAAAEPKLQQKQNHGCGSSSAFCSRTRTGSAFCRLQQNQNHGSALCSRTRTMAALDVKELSKTPFTSSKHSIKFEHEIEFGGGYIKHLSGFANQNNRGFIPNYDQWSFHGEPLHYTEECQIGGAMEERVEAENEEMVDGDHVERVDVNLTDPYRTMILEAAGPSFNPNTNVEFDEPPNQDAKKFYDLLKATKKPLYEGCKVHPRYGIIEINRKKHFSKYEPFVLAQQSQQVYFAEYASKKRDRADWLVVCKIKSRSVINAPELAYQEDEVSIQNEIDDDDEDPQEELGDEEEVGEEVEIEIEDDDVNDQEDIVEMDEFNDQDDIEGGFEIDDSSTEDENEDSEDQIDYGSDGDNTSMTRGKGKARSTGVDRGGYHKVGRNKSIESVQCPTMKQVPAEQVPIVQPPIEQVPIVQLSIEQVPIVELPIEQSPVVDRPPSYVAEEDHLESEEPSMTNTQQENAYL
ncbi:pheromone-processing carboxypeptidase KEX1-like [Senna tora]|uniref:Pheromone-processing carboxypeptidase KEX1-like n=1 Tax=Senna tora TaxID=362788 RepID=A0A834TGU2_9FABA|nr:pheromone-processing carboxypeptidase KEX1-like [Senna tora]